MITLAISMYVVTCRITILIPSSESSVTYLTSDFIGGSSDKNSTRLLI